MFPLIVVQLNLQQNDLFVWFHFHVQKFEILKTSGKQCLEWETSAGYSSSPLIFHKLKVTYAIHNQAWILLLYTLFVIQNTLLAVLEMWTMTWVNRAPTTNLWEDNGSSTGVQYKNSWLFWAKWHFTPMRLTPSVKTRIRSLWVTYKSIKASV